MSVTSQRLRQLREISGKSQGDVAKILGISRPAYVSYETGRSTPSRRIGELANIFNVSVDYLLGKTDDPRIHLMGDISDPAHPMNAYAKDDTPEYYRDPEVARLAQELKENPGLHVLMDASRGLKKESIEEVKRFIEFQKAKEMGDID